MGPSSRLFLICCVFLWRVQAIKLPGRCPKVLPSVTNLSLPIEVYYSIPFEIENPSNIFRENGSSKRTIIIRTQPEFTDRGITIVRPLHENRGTYLVISEVVGRNNFSFTVESNVWDMAWKKIVCPFATVEELHVWRDGTIGFLWSCREDGDGQNHDEALLVSTERDKPPREEIRVSARKYVSEALVKLIDPENPFALGFEKQYGYFYCPLVVKEVRATWPFVGLFWFIMIMIFVVYLR